MLSKFQPSFTFFLIALFTSNGALSQEFDPIIVISEERPSDLHQQFQSPIRNSFGCIGSDTGEPLPCNLWARVFELSDVHDLSGRLSDSPDITCPAMAGTTVEDLINKGGHLETGAPVDALVLPGTNLQIVSSFDGDVLSEAAAGPTSNVEATTSGDGYGHVTVLSYAPEHSKAVEYRYIYDAAPGYVRVPGGQSRDYISETKLIAASTRLKRLDGCIGAGRVSGENYRLVNGVNATNNHPEPNWGLAVANFRLKRILESYITDNGDYLSLNDMSLPIGGKFSPHDTHRTGRDIDLNTAVYDGEDDTEVAYDCRTDTRVDDVVSAVGNFFYPNIGDGANRFPNLDCYSSSGNMHIDLLKGF